MTSNDLVYTPESLAKDAADYKANAPLFTPVLDDTQSAPVGDMANPVAWMTTKTGKVELIRGDERWLVEFYAQVGDDLLLGCRDRRWVFAPLTDKINIKAPLMTQDLQRLKSLVEIQIDNA